MSTKAVLGSDTTTLLAAVAWRDRPETKRTPTRCPSHEGPALPPSPPPDVGERERGTKGSGCGEGHERGRRDRKAIAALSLLLSAVEDWSERTEEGHAWLL